MSTSGRASFRMSSPRVLAKGLGLGHQSKEQTIGGVIVSNAASDASDLHDIGDISDKIMEGHLFVRIHVRRRRYCVLRGRTLLVFDSKDDELASATKSSKAVGAKKVITVVGVRNAAELDKSVRTSLLGLSQYGSLENALVISTQKSKLVVVEAETPTEKQRWLHAMSCLNLASSTSEKSLFVAMLQDSTSFDAHVAVSLLHQYRDNAVATELIIDHLAEYAERNIDDVEFYIQQIMHLVVNAEMAKPEKLVRLLLSICKAKAYVEHLGNCIHLALQLFWLLEAKIEDKDPRTYNLCAKLLMSIEAKVVNQHFELPVRGSGSSSSNSSSGGSSDGSGAVSALLMEIPGMRERLQEMHRNSAGNQASKRDATAKTAAVTRPEELSPTFKRSLTSDTSDTVASTDEASVDAKPATTGSAATPETTAAVVLSPDDVKLQRELVLKWMEKERQKRYKYFHEQRDFVKALADISEKMRLVDPPHERKRHLPAALEALVVPDMAYIPLGRVSDPFCRITRVLKDEGTVFSTHSRAPCLLCFEVIEDHVNAAGHRSSISKAPPTSPSAVMSASSRWSRRSARSSESSVLDEEAEIVGFIKKFSINGKLICVDEPAPSGGSGDEICDDNEHRPRDASATHTEALAAFQDLERQLDISIVQADSDSVSPPPPLVPMRVLPLTREDALCSAASSSNAPSSSGSMHDETSLIRRHSQSAYECGLSKMMSEGGVFGESWKEKKERIRASSPYGHLPGWNIISLISKSNDDIRQEVFAMQLISKFQDIFRESDLPLFLRPYRIVSTGKSCGLLETITDAQSLDALKKQRDYQGLRKHFERTYGGGDPASRAFKTAQRNFLHSLVAYSLVCYLLQIKDRHNGNILLDTDGHLVHIDFGFLLGIAPGGSWSFETAPFKLTGEMVAVLGGVSSSLFGDFVMLFVRGLLAAQRSAEKIITLVEIMMRHSSFPCFQDRDVSKDLQRLRERFLLPLSTEQLVKTCMKMISASYKNKWTKRYDQFQKLTNGILP